MLLGFLFQRINSMKDFVMPYEKIKEEFDKMYWRILINPCMPQIDMIVLEISFFRGVAPNGDAAILMRF